MTLDEIKEDIEIQWGMYGLSDGLYGDYASEVAKAYAAPLLERIAELEAELNQMESENNELLSRDGY